MIVERHVHPVAEARLSALHFPDVSRGARILIFSNERDAIYVEATRVRRAASARRIVEWINDHLGRVRIVPPRLASTSNAASRKVEPFVRLENRPRSKFWRAF
jgi:hypothetical protein